MRRKTIKLLLVLLLVLLALFGVFGAWTWYQMNVGRSLQMGDVQTSSALGGLVIPQTAVLYGVLAGFFLLLTVVSIRTTYRLITYPSDDVVAETAVADEIIDPDNPNHGEYREHTGEDE